MEAPFRDAVIESEDDWGDTGIWRIIQREGKPYNRILLSVGVGP